jgi:hypothetical protein
MKMITEKKHEIIQKNSRKERRNEKMESNIMDFSTI